jgi:hypothetical protein
MNERLKFQCWNCERVFSLWLETEERPDLRSECPFCHADVRIELDPYRRKGTTVFKTDSSEESERPTADASPPVIPTKKPDDA